MNQQKDPQTAKKPNSRIRRSYSLFSDLQSLLILEGKRKIVYILKNITTQLQIQTRSYEITDIITIIYIKHGREE